jgi:hypothetical protein
MKVKIEINCEDERELMIHLVVIRDQIRKALKKNENFEGELKDSNCYGYHTIKII